MQDTRSQLWALAYCDPDSNIFNSVLGHLQPECVDVHAEMKSAAQNVYEREQEAQHNERAKLKEDRQKKRKEQEQIEREKARNKVIDKYSWIMTSDGITPHSPTLSPRRPPQPVAPPYCRFLVICESTRRGNESIHSRTSGIDLCACKYRP